MLLSGGIDSPVASYKLLQSGFDIQYYIHFATNIDKVDNIIDILDCLQPGMTGKLLVVDFNEIQEMIVQTCHESYRTIMYKAFMILLANRIADEHGINFVATGNSLGQVAKTV